MSFQLTEPILIIGLGGAGTKLATEASKALDAECMLISNDEKDLDAGCTVINISTRPIVNPSVQLIRGTTNKVSGEIQNAVLEYSSIIIMANLAGKAGAAMAPIVSGICKEAGKNIMSFATMPFKFEKDRIFNAGISLKRLRADSGCTVVVDNDAFLDNNPDLTPNECYKIANSAVAFVVNSLKTSDILEETNVLSTSKENVGLEESLKESLKMLYANTSPDNIKRSIMYLLGGPDTPVGVINSVANIAGSVFNDDITQVNVSASSEKSKVVLLSTVQGETRFDKYDPLGVIPEDRILDWDIPDSSIDCELDLHQLE